MMHAVLLTSHGGLDELGYRADVEVPFPKKNEVLIHVKGAGINNTDINTRVGWYSKTYPLKDIKKAQEDFLAKKFTGKLVLTPPHDSL